MGRNATRPIPRGQRFERCEWCLSSYFEGERHCCVCRHHFRTGADYLAHHCTRLENNLLYRQGQVWVEYTWRTDETKAIEAKEKARERAERGEERVRARMPPRQDVLVSETPIGRDFIPMPRQPW